MKDSHSIAPEASENPTNGGSAGRALEGQSNVPDPRLLGLKAGAAYLSLSYWSLRELILDGVIPHLKYGKKILVDREDLDIWIQVNKETGVL